MAANLQFATLGRNETPLVPTPEHRAPVLTSRQLQVLQLIVDGKSDAEIATALGRSKNTVNVHRTNIMRILGLRKTIHMVVYAIREGLVDIGSSSECV